MQTQIGIVGAGPAGLLLSQLLHLRGIESVIIEDRSRDYIERRVRAGVLEQATVDLLTEAGVDGRLRREGLRHQGIELRFNGRGHRIDFDTLTNGGGVTVYGQQEVVKDLIAARLAAGGQILFEATEVSVHDLDGATPRIRFRQDGTARELRCEFIAGCDGFHGVCRPSIPDGVLSVYEHQYPFAWLGILAEAAPSSDELIYANHQRGFALHSMRSPSITRNYIQCAPDEDINNWPDQKIWQELQTRLATSANDWTLNEGPVIEKGITAMRSFVVEPMRYGKLYLAGDAAHIVPPTGAKGMNLAVGDVRELAKALTARYRDGDESLLDGYSATCLRRIWRVQRFSWWMTSMLHRFSEHDAFQRRVQLAELDTVVSSTAAAKALAEHYTGTA